MSHRSVVPFRSDSLPERHLREPKAYRDRLLSLVESPGDSDMTPAELLALDPDAIHFKSDPRWAASYSELKAELAGRPHLARRSDR